MLQVKIKKKQQTNKTNTSKCYVLYNFTCTSISKLICYDVSFILDFFFLIIAYNNSNIFITNIIIMLSMKASFHGTTSDCIFFFYIFLSLVISMFINSLDPGRVYRPIRWKIKLNWIELGKKKKSSWKW